MHARRTTIWILLLALATAGPALAQQSTSYRLSEHAFNEGGRPEGGVAATSASFAVTLDAIGDTVGSGALGSGSFTLGGGFPNAYPPPGEVTGLGFTDKTTLIWDPEPTVGSYRLYRGDLDLIANLTYGDCEETAIPGTTTTEAGPIAPGQEFYYLVTAANLIAEEGTKGSASSGAERPNPSPCP